MPVNFHPESLPITAEKMYEAITSGFHWVAAFGPNGEACRTLVQSNSLTRRLEPAEPSDPILITNITPLP